jgi:hypothetical protein
MRRLLPLGLVIAAACARGSSRDATPPIASAGGPQPTALAAEIQADQAIDQQVRTVLGPPVDASKKLEVVEVDVELKTPSSQRNLVPYLIRPEVWTLVKVELLGPTRRLYRFQRVAAADGTPLPDIDPLRPR